MAARPSLTPDQRALLESLVDADRDVSPRRGWWCSGTGSFDGTVEIHQNGQPGEIVLPFHPHSTLKFFEQIGLVALSEERRTPSSPVSTYTFHLLQKAFDHVNWLRRPWWWRWATNQWGSEPSRELIFLLLGSLLGCIIACFTSLLAPILRAAADALLKALSRLIP